VAVAAGIAFYWLYTQISKCERRLDELVKEAGAEVNGKISELGEPNRPDETKEVMKAEKTNLILPLWRTVCRVKRDPLIRKQEFGLVSFAPARGATPNQNGLYGVAKLRGNFGSEEAASQEAERIIREVDSANSVFVVRVGQTFPIAGEVHRFVGETVNVDLSETVSAEDAEREKKAQKKDAKDKKQLLDKEKQLLSRNKEIQAGTYEEDVLDVYTRAQIKRAQLQHTLAVTEEKVKEIHKVLDQAKEDVVTLDARHPELKAKYIEHYLEARREAGLSTDWEAQLGPESPLYFLKYL
jgi:hypothetical protein